MCTLLYFALFVGSITGISLSLFSANFLVKFRPLVSFLLTVQKLYTHCSTVSYGLNGLYRLLHTMDC